VDGAGGRDDGFCIVDIVDGGVPVICPGCMVLYGQLRLAEVHFLLKRLY